MIRRWPFLFLVILILFLPVQAHVPVSANNNDNITAAFSVENPVKSYVIYGDLHHAGDVAYYRFSMNAGDRLSLSLMTPGYDTPLPEMIILIPQGGSQVRAAFLQMSRSLQGTVQRSSAGRNPSTQTTSRFLQVQFLRLRTTRSRS